MPPVSRSVYTDEKGRYEVSGLRAGRYGVSVTKSGYLTLAHGQVRARESGRPLELSETLPLDKIDFALPRASVIIARVTDQFGDPVRGVNVRAYIPRFTNGQRQLSSGGGNASVTDDRGETRIFGLPPGDYYILATPNFPTTWRGELETLYPGTTELSAAQIVRLGIGEEAFVTFPMLRSRLSSLSGRIISSDGAPLATPNVSLQYLQLSGGGSSRRLNVAPDGSFHEENLQPGDWMIVSNEPEYGSVRTRLRGDDVEGLLVTTRKRATVRGGVTFEGGPPPAQGFEFGVAFDGPTTLVSGAGYIRSGARVGTIPVAPDTQWAFESQISGVGVIRARLPNWLLKAVLLDGRDITDTMLDIGTAYAGKTVEVVMTQRRAELSGAVTTDSGQPASDYVVVLFPEDESHWTSYGRFFGSGRPNQQGRFTIQNLPPARYLAAAVEYLEPGEDRNPDTLARLRGSATVVVLAEGESKSVALRMSR